MLADQKDSTAVTNSQAGTAGPGGAPERSVGGSIKVEGVTVRYRSRKGQASSVPAVEDITCEIGAGEFVAVIGPSGCGKSTLLKAVAGLLPLSSGDVTLGDGRGAKVGFVFQSDALLPWRTASANVELALRLSGSKEGATRQRAERLLKELGLGDSAGKYPAQLSGGMRKRVALARTLAYEPSLFLMDEPFSALDAQTRIHVGNFFLRVLERTGQTVLFVTHDIEEAVALADRVLVMTDAPGRIAISIDVPLPRPRDYHATRLQDGFNDLQQAVWNALDQSHGAMDGGAG